MLQRHHKKEAKRIIARKIHATTAVPLPKFLCWVSKSSLFTQSLKADMVEFTREHSACIPRKNPKRRR